MRRIRRKVYTFWASSGLFIVAQKESLQLIRYLLFHNYMANSQNSADDELEFSLIGASNKKRKEVAFSVTSLFSNQPKEESQKPSVKEQSKKEDAILQGSFMKMLDKFEQELSYEQDTYDLYEEIGKSTLGENNYKEHSNLKITKETAEENTEDAYNDYRDLIVDFTPKKEQISNFLCIMDKKQNKAQKNELSNCQILSTSRQTKKKIKHHSKGASCPNQKQVQTKLHKVKSSNKLLAKEPMKHSHSHQLKEPQNQLRKDKLKSLIKLNATQENRRDIRAKDGLIFEDAFSSYYEESQVIKKPKKLTVTTPRNIYKSRDNKSPSNSKCFKKKTVTPYIASK